MAVIKCKMCGGDIELSPDKTFGVCECCGSTMTFPKIDDDQRAAAFNRGNYFRRIGEFDKALAVYEHIMEEDNTDAEAHWCCALCRYGIEYVEDPTSHEYLPTCHRASFDNFLEDVDYQAALQYSDGITKRQYEKDAAKIAEVQHGILATCQNEQPFDIFICYKESDENGSRTKDSTLAQEIYYQLTDQGWRVFFARITLEDKVGTEYEPYIFAALNSAKVMVVVGTKPEYFNAVWVKNEWSRFLAMMKKDRSKLLLPCYRDMDPYDLPEALSVLQSYDMSKIGFIQDLTRGISKVLDADKKLNAVKETVVVSGGKAAVEPLLKRAFMFLEDCDWQEADTYCEKVLDQDPENARAYLGKLMASLRVSKQEHLADCKQSFENDGDYQRILRFGSEELCSNLKDCIARINERNETARLTGIYNKAKAAMDSADTKEKFKAAAEIFATIAGFKDANEQIGICQRQIEEIKAKEEVARREAERKAEERRIANAVSAKKRKKILAIAAPILCVCVAFFTMFNMVIIPNNKYHAAVALMEAGNYKDAMLAFGAVGDYKDAILKKMNCLEKITVRETVSAGSANTTGLKVNGTAVNAGSNSFGQCDVVSNWSDIVAVSEGFAYTVGLKSDGTVVATKFTDDSGYAGQCDVSDWSDIVAISAGFENTAGLKSDGTVVVVGANQFGQCDVSSWKDIVAVSVGYRHIVGLRSDGTVVTVGDNSYGQCDVSSWKDIVAVSAGAYHTVGLKSDGTVVNSYGQCDVSDDWKDIVAVSAGGAHTVGLRSDGTVVTVGDNSYGQCDVSSWKDIVAVSAGAYHTVGLKSDGTVVAVGQNEYGQCDVSDWTNIRLPDDNG